jgi:ABC-type Fe3+-siderophore transport system permease subunit
MGLDIRWPIGLMFTLIGVMLAINGALVKSDHAISLGININLIWGIVLLVFGAFMLVLAVKGKNKPGPKS